MQKNAGYSVPNFYYLIKNVEIVTNSFLFYLPYLIFSIRSETLVMFLPINFLALVGNKAVMKLRLAQAGAILLFCGYLNTHLDFIGSSNPKTPSDPTYVTYYSTNV